MVWLQTRGRITTTAAVAQAVGASSSFSNARSTSWELSFQGGCGADALDPRDGFGCPLADAFAEPDRRTGGARDQGESPISR